MERIYMALMCGPIAYEMLRKNRHFAPEKTYRTEENEEFTTFLCIWEWPDVASIENERKEIADTLNILNKKDEDDFEYGYRLFEMSEDFQSAVNTCNEPGEMFEMDGHFYVSPPEGTKEVL